MVSSNRWNLLLLAASLIFCGASPLFAQFQTGDVVAEVQPGCAIPFCSNSLIVYSPNGTLKSQITLVPSQLTAGPYSGSDLVDNHGVLFWTNGLSVYRIDSAGALHALAAPAGLHFQSLVANAKSEILASTDDGNIVRFDANGNFLGTTSIALTLRDIDLLSDQCTLLYVTSALPGSNAISRFNLCAMQPLTSLATSLPSGVSSFRIRPEGTILAATYSGGTFSGGMYLLDPSGGIQRTYGNLFSFAFAFDRDGQSFWVSPGVSIQKRDVNTGATSTSITLPNNLSVVSLVVIGEPRAATNGPSIPTLSSLALAILCLVLVSIGIFRTKGC